MREQCWLNETLTSCTWIPEGLTLPETDTSDDMEVTESDLQSVLKGTLPPHAIPQPTLTAPNPPRAQERYSRAASR